MPKPSEFGRWDVLPPALPLHVLVAAYRADRDQAVDMLTRRARLCADHRRELTRNPPEPSRSLGLRQRQEGVAFLDGLLRKLAGQHDFA